MVKIFRFAAVRPEPVAAARVAAVPYDVVTAEEAAAIIRENPMSFLRISRPDAELPDIPAHDGRVYARARQLFDDLRSGGVFIDDGAPAMYIYQVVTRAETFSGLCCCLPVEDYESGAIRRHEQTRYDKEEDRTRHIDAVNANTGPVVLIYRDAGSLARLIEGLADILPPQAEVRWHDGSLHRIFRIADPGDLGRIEALFSSVDRLYIADGHHRAKSAVNVAKRRRQEGGEGGEEDRFMGVLFADSGVRIHGYSRMVRDLAGRSSREFMDEVSKVYTISACGPVDRSAFQITPRQPGDGHLMHMYIDHTWYECRAKGELPSDPIAALDVSVLQREVLEPILGITDPRGDERLQYLGGARPIADLEGMVDRDEYAVAFSMQPVRVETVLSIADENGIMPPKSTWFEPKLLSGLIIHTLS
ncbi:MAG: DUF1015 domain-containing protein [Methanomicrobiales archaeon]|nr:DUF1015 domain-containing protein [Methanomicrobiales archaeon]